MTDINELIAKTKGWENYDWSSKYTLPDYLHDARLYMALFEEIKLDGYEFRLESDTTGQDEALYTAVILELRNDTKGTGWNMKIISTQPTIGGAICAAWCAWKGVEG